MVGAVSLPSERGSRLRVVSATGGCGERSSLGRPSCLWVERPPFGSWPPACVRVCCEHGSVDVALARELSVGGVKRARGG
jgi:hypothetical protein